MKSVVVRNIAKKYFLDIKGMGKQEIFSLCEKLLESDYGEEAFIAFEWAYSLRKEYEPADFQVFERWVKEYVNNWAKCDTLGQVGESLVSTCLIGDADTSGQKVDVPGRRV